METNHFASYNLLPSSEVDDDDDPLLQNHLCESDGDVTFDLNVEVAADALAVDASVNYHRPLSLSNWKSHRCTIVCITFTFIFVLVGVMVFVTNPSSSTKYYDLQTCIETRISIGIPSSYDLEQWFSHLEKCLKNESISVFRVATTEENRTVFGLKVGASSPEASFPTEPAPATTSFPPLSSDPPAASAQSVAKRKKFSVWIHGGIHAREWISVTSAIFVMDQILQIQLSDHDPENVLRFCDWYFVPLVNPDGYNFSRSRPENKMWRKNRHVSSNECEGVDLNRNWDFKWKGSGCDDTYAGPRPFSEPETRGLRDILDGLAEKQHLDLFVSLHSLGEMWLLPWAYDSPVKIANYDEMMALGKKGVEGIQRRHGAKWKLGQASDLLDYAPRGSALDYVASKGVPYVYSLELRPEDHDTYGHFPPEDEILKSAEEVWEGIKSVVGALFL